MGTGSSVLRHDERTTKDPQKSIRAQFQQEFGVTVNNDKPAEPPKTESYFNEDVETQSELAESRSGKESLSDNGSLSELKRPSVADSRSSVGSAASNVPVSAGSKNRVTFNTAVFRAKTLFLKPVLKNRPEKDKRVVKKQNNPGLLKEMYQRMDPSVNTDLTNLIVGEIEVAVRFKLEDSLLLVKVGRGKDLPKEHGSPAPDPFVVADVFSGKTPSDLTTQKTKVKIGTRNPYFHEILSFPMSQTNISDGKLRVSVWDRASATQNIFLGESIQDLCRLDLIGGNFAWYKLYPRVDITISGTLEISVAFNEPHSLVLSINKGNNLKICDEEQQSSDPYVRVQVTGLPTKFETAVQCGTVNPVWMESFEFDVHPTEFSRRVIVLNVLHKNATSGRDQHLGDIHIPMSEYDRSQAGLPNEYPLKDMRHTQQTKSLWSEEGLALEFCEAMRAHMTYGYPKFIFKKQHQGKMMISCRSKQAQTQAKMVIENGVLSLDNVQM